MNQIKMLLGAALLSGLISTSVYAGSGAPANPPRGGTAVPHPEVMVGPEDLPRRFLDVTVKVSFTVDEKGQPRDIKLVTPTDRDLARSLLPAIAQWRFTPAFVNGEPVSKRVVMPVKIVAGT